MNGISEYGMVARNATKDANAGIVDPPAKQHIVRESSSKQKRVTSLDEGVASFGEMLGSALEARATEEATAINARRIASASARQGVNEAINRIDDNKKRTGWEKAIFGQNVEYRAAQQQGVQNAVNTSYLKSASELSKYAGESSEVYEGRLADDLQKTLEPFKGDNETKSMVIDAWSKNARKLAGKHREAHYAFNQQQQRDTFSKGVNVLFDTWVVDTENIISRGEGEDLVKAQEDFFKGKSRPDGMDNLAWKTVVNEQLSKSLRAGNIGAFNAAKNAGWLDNLNAVEQESMDSAIRVYDTKFKRDVSLTYADAELNAEEAKTKEDAVAIYTELKESIEGMGLRSSGTEASELAIARGKVNAQKAINAIGAKAAKASDKAELKAKELAGVKNALRGNAVTKGAGLAQIAPKKAMLEEAADAIVTDEVAMLTGVEEVTAGEAVEVLAGNVEVSAALAKTIKDYDTPPPIVTNFVTSVMNGLDTMVGEDGLISEEGLVAMSSVAQFATNGEQFKDIVGAEGVFKFQMLQRGIAGRQTVERTQTELDKYYENRGNANLQGVEWGLDRDTHETKRDRVQSLVAKMNGGIKPTGASLTHFMEEFTKGLTIYGNDMRSAENYLRTSVTAANTLYKGIRINGGKKLNEVTDYNFKELMDGAQRTIGDSHSLLTPFLSTLGYNLENEKGEVLSNLSQINNLSIYTVDGIGGFYMDSNGIQRVHVSEEDMQSMAASIEQEERMEAMLDEASSWRRTKKWFNKAINEIL